MSHHFDRGDSEFLRQFREQCGEVNTPPLGGTGKFPDGKKLCDNDKGEIRFAIAGDADRQLVHLDFGAKPIAFVSMTPQQAIDVAQSLIKQARGISREPLTVILH